MEMVTEIGAIIKTNAIYAQETTTDLPRQVDLRHRVDQGKARDQLLRHLQVDDRLLDPANLFTL